VTIVTRPADLGFRMPAEWEPHARCWMMWPCREALYGNRLEAARDAYAEVANAIAQFEPVTMIASSDEFVESSLKVGTGVSNFSLEHDDSWMRDAGPTFVRDGPGRVAGVAWRWNAWGNKYPDHAADAAVAKKVLEHLEMKPFEAPLVMEGGAFHVDGEGTLLTTEQCLLHPNRNPDLSKAEIDKLLADYLGIERTIWLGRGLEDDDTDGHVDEVACFVRPGVVMALTTSDPADGNYAALNENLARLRAASDAKGRALEIIEIEQPRRRVLENGWRMSLSYTNFYIANGGIVMPAFEDPQDAKAFEIVSKAFPDRKVIQIPALDIAYGGGCIHCITQQQPAGEPLPV
jgi:agmatine deiminase